MLDSGLGTAKKKIKEIRINLHFFLWNDFSANLLNSKKYHRWYSVDVIAFFKIPEMSKMRLKWKIKQYVKYLKWEKVISSQNDDCVVGSLGGVGVPGEKRCGLMSLINNWLDFFWTISITDHNNFQEVPRDFWGQGDPDLWHIDWMEFLNCSDAAFIHPWTGFLLPLSILGQAFHKLQCANMPGVVGNGENVLKSIPPPSLCLLWLCVSQKQLWARVQTLEFPWVPLLSLTAQFCSAISPLDQCL